MTGRAVKALAGGGLLLAAFAGLTPPTSGGSTGLAGTGPRDGAGLCAPGGVAAAGAANSAGGAVLPISGPYVATSEFGMRSFRGSEMHWGLDLASPSAAPILAAAAGTVTHAAPTGSAGNMVVIDHGDGTSTTYMHLSTFATRQGASVAAGEQIGTQGTTGDSTGPHLHFEVRTVTGRVDPRVWLTQRGAEVAKPGGTGTGPDVGARGARGSALAGCLPGESAPGGEARGVPEWAAAWVAKAAGTCEQVTGPLLAAQIEAESGWNRDAVSPVGARGLSQFMPATWAAYGRDDDGNGRVDPSDVGDAIMAQARYDCEVARVVRGVPGDGTDLMLAAYNAGPGAVLLHDGVPPYGETRAYVVRIKAGMARYSN